MSLMLEEEVPPVPVTANTFTVFAAPQWATPLVNSIAYGGGEPEAINGIGLAGENYVFYRRLSDADRERFLHLMNVEEVWLVFRPTTKGD